LKENMKMLIDLQSCDTEIGDLERRIAEAPLRIKEIEDRLAEMDDEWEAAEKQLEELKLKRRGLEKDIEMVESQIGKANTKLSNIKSNKEYKAALKEIDDLTREKSRLEDKAIEFMEQVDSLSAQSLAKKEERDRFRQEVMDEKENILQEIGSMDEALKTLGMKRGKFCMKVSGELLKRYDFIRERKSGVALSPVLNGVCQVCHMEIPPQKYNELLRGESLLDCPYCHRIIYWGDNERFQKAGKEE
jgi:predicted  nucleic acid-binding Zn-ribbon protein